MDINSAKRIACFINDTENGSIYIHFKGLKQEFTFRRLGTDQQCAFYPVLEIQYTDLKIKTLLQAVVEFGKNPIYGTTKNPLPPLDSDLHVSDQFTILVNHIFKENYDYHLNSKFAQKLHSLFVGLEDIRLKLDNIELQKEPIKLDNQLELSGLLHRLFALHDTEVNCVSHSELTYNEVTNITIVPTLMNGAWTIYATNNNDIHEKIADHHALWDGFDKSVVYFNAQIRTHTKGQFIQIVKKSGWDLSSESIELINAFHINELNGDVYTDSILDTIQD